MKRRNRRVKQRFRLNGTRFLKVVLCFALCVYVGWVFLGQQIDSNANVRKIADIDGKIAVAEQEYADLLHQKEISDTPEYKEKIARERGGLVMPGEIVFIDPLKN